MPVAIHKANDIPEFLGIVAKFTDTWFPQGAHMGALVSRGGQRQLAAKAQAVSRPSTEKRYECARR